MSPFFSRRVCGLTVIDYIVQTLNKEVKIRPCVVYRPEVLPTERDSQSLRQEWQRCRKTKFIMSPPVATYTGEIQGSASVLQLFGKGPNSTCHNTEDYIFYWMTPFPPLPPPAPPIRRIEGCIRLLARDNLRSYSVKYTCAEETTRRNI